MDTLNIESAQLVRQGFLLIPQNCFNEAIETFSQAIKLDQDSLLAYQGRALCYTFLLDGSINDKEKIEHAVSDLEKALLLARGLSDELP